MSSRVLKKLHGDKDLELKEAEEQLSDVDQDLGAGSKKKQLNLNRYDLLNQQSPSESEVKEDDNETEHASAASNASMSNLSKKKKKKRKKRGTKHSNQISSEDNEISDKFISDLDKIIGKPYKAVSLPDPVYKTLLSVETKNLNPQLEMRRTFGKRVVKIEQRRGRGQKPTLKSTYLVSTKDSWPPVSKDIIYMKISNDQVDSADHANSVVWFAFEHSKYYQNVQNMFLSAVEKMDSDFLIRIIKRCPYHVDSLIQLSELCKMTENYAMASELIERAILVLESSLHPTFSLTSGNCRMDYRRQENRAFFIVLFKHAQYLEARACCRTAFEISKLILSLDPDTDPLAMILVIDYYALRSKQYEWFKKFYEEWESIKNLSQLPNMAYSYALALFQCNEDLEKADAALQYALLMFPGVLRPLLEEMSVQTDRRASTHSYFQTGISGAQSPALEQLVSLYICRAKVMWRDQEILPWLEKNVNIVLDQVDQKSDIVNEYNVKRSQRYVNPPRAILRHVVLSDYKEKVPLANFVTKEKDPIMMYDPLPPLDSINFYQKKTPVTSPTSASVPNNRAVSMFFQSMLPTFNLRDNGGSIEDLQINQLQEMNINLDMGDEAGGADGAVAGMESYRELRHSLTSFIDAMRDFLSNIGIAERTSNVDGDDNDSSGDDSGNFFD